MIDVLTELCGKRYRISSNNSGYSETNVCGTINELTHITDNIRLNHISEE